MTKYAILPLKVFNKQGIVSIIDAEDREVIHWSGFDGSALNKSARLQLAKDIVSAMNRKLPKKSEYKRT